MAELHLYFLIGLLLYSKGLGKVIARELPVAQQWLLER